MGKKAFLLLLYFFAICFTFVLAIFAILASTGHIYNPYHGEFIPLLTLGLPLLLIANGILLIWWAIKWKRWVFVSLIGILANYSFIGSMYQFGSSEQVQTQEETINVVTYNVQNFDWQPTLWSLTDIAVFLLDENIDVICFQEYAESETFNEDSVASVLNFLPYYKIERNSEEDLNLAIFSKFPISSTGNYKHKGITKAMWVDVQIEGKPVRVFNCHLQTTNVNQTRGELEKNMVLDLDTEVSSAVQKMLSAATKNYRIRIRQADALNKIIGKSPYPTIVCGDLNSVPTSYSYWKIRGELIDGFLECGSGYAATYRYMKQLYKIDYIFHSKELKGINYWVKKLDYSDHYPTVMRLSF